MTKLHNLLKPVVNSKETNLNKNKKHGTTIWLCFTCLLFIISMVACGPTTSSDDGDNQLNLIDLDLQFTGFQINEKDKDEKVTLPLPVGKDFNLIIQVTNQSTNDYDGTVTYYQSEDNNISTDDNFLGSINVSLAGGKSWEATFTPTAPDRAGTYYYGACLSFQDQENVNQVTCTASFQVMVRNLLGLALKGFQINGQDKDEMVFLLAGRDLTMAVEVVNQSINNYQGTVTYYQSEDNNISTNDNFLGSINVSLAGGKSWEATFTPVAPDRAGTYYYGACLSFQDQENVNQVTCTASFQVMVRNLLGLELMEFQINEKNDSEIVHLLVGRDLNINIAVQVTNQAENKYDGIVTYYYVSDDNDILTNGNSLGSTNVSLNGRESLNAMLTIPSLNDVGTYYYGGCVSFQDQDSVNQVICTATVQVVVRNFLENVYNVDDSAASDLELRGVRSVTTAQVGGTTYLFTAGEADDDVSVFSVDPDNESLIHITKVTDDNNLKLKGVYSVTTAQVGGTTYLFTAGRDDSGVSVFSVNPNDGTLINVDNVTDDDNLRLDGAASVTTAQVGGITYLFTAGRDDSGVSVFSVNPNDGTLNNVYNVDDSDNSGFELAGAISVTTAQVGGTTYLFTAGFSDHGVSVFNVNPNGTLNNVYNVDDSDNSGFELAGAFSVTTAEVGGTTYLFTAGLNDSGVSVFSVNPDDGTLSNVFNVDDSDNSGFELAGAFSVTTAVVGGTTYLFTAGQNDHGVSMFSVDVNGELSNVFNVDDRDNSGFELRGIRSVTTAVVEGTTYLFTAGALDNGISMFKVNAE